MLKSLLFLPLPATMRLPTGLLFAALLLPHAHAQTQAAMPPAEPPAASVPPDVAAASSAARPELAQTLATEIRAKAARPLEVHLLVENDLFAEKFGLAHSDRWYTSGVKSMVKINRDKPPPGYSKTWEALVDKDPNAYQVEYGFTMGQMIYTPGNIRTALPQPQDRFWGGWLYLGTVLQTHPKAQSPADGMDTFELDVGVTGPWSLAQQSQKTIHAIIGAPTPVGWNNQIKSELGVQTTYLHQRRLRRAQRGPLSFDLSGHYGFGLGTMFDYLNAGLTLRIGNNLEEAPAGTIDMPSLMAFGERANRAYLLARFDARASYHNTFIEGSFFRGKPHDTEIHAKRLIGQATLGLVVESATSRFHRAAFLFSRRSREFNNPPGSQSVQSFGTLMLQMEF